MIPSFDRSGRRRRKVALEAAAVGLGGVKVRAVGKRLGGSRTDLWRVTDGERPLVVKSYRDPESFTWRREAAGLAAAHGTGCPELVALVADPAVVVMTDLGTGPNLADHLLGRDPAKATDGLRAWGRALAHLHSQTMHRTDIFAAHLGDDLPLSVVASEVAGLPQGLAALAADHGLPLVEDLTGLVGKVQEPLGRVDRHVVTPGDTCPDNNVIIGDALRLLDFEFAEVRHPAWDIAYLRVPWPTCWCAWQIPPEPGDAALATYRMGAAESLPWVGEPGFEQDLSAATLLWCLVSASMFLPGALDPEAKNEDAAKRPGRWTMILSRLELASRLDGPPALTAYAGQLAAELTRRWGPHPLATAPAFAS